jgi:hypothetical protein
VPAERTHGWPLWEYRQEWGLNSASGPVLKMTREASDSGASHRHDVALDRIRFAVRASQSYCQHVSPITDPGLLKSGSEKTT